MDQVVGVLGGGQLGRMLVEAASRLDVRVDVLDGPNSPAKQISAHDGHLNGSFADAALIDQLADRVDVLTVEIEHVDADALDRVAHRCRTTGGRSGKGVRVYPSADVIRTIQDKLVQHEHLRRNGVAVADFVAVDGEDLVAAARKAGDQLGYPFMLKARTLAYDGRGNFLVRTAEDVARAVDTLGNGKRALYAERFAPFEREAAVMVVRGPDGKTRMYPAVETVHRENVCHVVSAPLRSRSSGLSSRAQALAQQAIDVLGEGAVGVFGVEMFVMPDGRLLINEIAPRPHNSGHYTIEACATSQFENHLRAILGLPIGDPSLKVGSSIMLNLLGDVDVAAVSLAALAIDGATVHLYGKAESRAGRKMGHITVVGDSDAQARSRTHALLAPLPAAFRDHTPFEVGVPVGFSHPAPLVSIIMGSDSDLPTMLPGARILDQFEVPYELEVVSAHRTPALMAEFATAAAERGVRVIIAGAGAAAHLPGMVAALTSLPVIGVPVKGSSLDGVDSLHSIVQMPRGIPVATVAIGNGTNAGLLAVRILGASIPRYRLALDAYARELAGQVEDKRKRMTETGWEKY